ncbi:MAG: sodium:solute symporter, partial [Alphaproteobacteria bacterium]
VIGTVQIAYNFGMYNFIVSGILWYLSAAIFAIFIAKNLNKTKALNLGEVIENRAGREISIYFSVLLYLKHLPVSYAIALSIFLSSVMNIEYIDALLLSVVIASILTALGGLRITMMLNFMQFAMIFLALGIILYMCFLSYGGIDFLIQKLPQSHISPSGGNSFTKILLWFVVALSTTLLSPVFHERCLAAKSPNIARTGIFIAIGFWIISDIMTTSIGLYAVAILGEGLKQDSLISLIDDILPHGLKGFCVVSLFITCISAIDSHFMGAVSVPAHILKSFGTKHHLRLRLLTILFTAIMTIMFALLLDKNIENAWLYFDSVIISTMLVPLALILLKKPILNNRAMMFGMLITTIFMMIYELSSLKQNESSFLVGIALSIVVNAVLSVSIKLIKSTSVS